MLCHHSTIAILLAFVVPGAVSTPTAFGQVEPEIAKLQAELQDLRSRVEQVEGTSFTTASGSVSYGNFEGTTFDAVGRQRSDAVIEAGIDFLFAKPQMKESFEVTSTNFATGTMNMIPFDFDYDLSPRAWLHLSSDSGPGIRARYWQYDDGSTPRSETAGLTTFPGATAVTVVFPAAISTMLPGDTLSSAMALDVATLDVEGTLPVRLGDAEILGSAGLRHASMDQAFRGAVVSGGAVTQSLAWNRGFDGLGLTVGGDVRAPLGSTELSFVSNLRGSLLFGNKTISRAVVGDVTPAPGITPPIVTLNNADEVSGIFEVALGLEWSRELGQNTSLFARGMYEGQLWTAAGAPTLTFLGFEGFSIAIGLAR